MDLRPTNNEAAAFKDPQPSGLSNGGPLAALLLSHPATAGRLCSFIAPCQRPAITQRVPSYL